MLEPRIASVIAAAIVQFGTPECESETLALSRWAYGQGYIDGLEERMADAPVPVDAKASA